MLIRGVQEALDVARKFISSMRKNSSVLRSKIDILMHCLLSGGAVY